MYRVFTIAFSCLFSSFTASSVPVDTPAARVATESDLLKSLDSADGGHLGLAKNVLWSRVGEDRVIVDVLTRSSPEEGPVVHEKVTEVYRVIQGGRTLQSGGALIAPKPMLDKEGKPLNPDNIGPSQVGTGTTGGHSQNVHVGDVSAHSPGHSAPIHETRRVCDLHGLRFNPRRFSPGK